MSAKIASFFFILLLCGFAASSKPAVVNQGNDPTVLAVKEAVVQYVMFSYVGDYRSVSDMVVVSTHDVKSPLETEQENRLLSLVKFVCAEQRFKSVWVSHYNDELPGHFAGLELSYISANEVSVSLGKLSAADVKVEGDQATVNIQLPGLKSNGQTESDSETIRLVKKNGWKVVLVMPEAKASSRPTQDDEGSQRYFYNRLNLITAALNGVSAKISTNLAKTADDAKYLVEAGIPQ